MAASFDDALAALELIETEYAGIDILSALANEEYDAGGELYDTIQMTFQILGRPGPLTVYIPYDDYWQTRAQVLIQAKANEVELIYEGAANQNVTPTRDMGPLFLPGPSRVPGLLPPGQF